MYSATKIGLIREGKNPPDTRVALTPRQCRELMKAIPQLDIVAQSSPARCYTDDEYRNEGIPVVQNVSDCDILLGIKEVNVDDLVPDKTYLFFSHTKKAQPYNRPLMQAMIQKRIRLVDYECLTHTDNQRILGFGFFAGLVGAHNGLLTYGRRTGTFSLPAAHYIGSLEGLKAVYDDLVLPPVRIVITGSGKVAAGVLEIMHDLDVEYIEPEDFLDNNYAYPVYTHLKGVSLYVRNDGGRYHREDFHAHPEQYHCVFEPFLTRADILMNGVYWDKHVPRLFSKKDVARPGYTLHVIADITCDMEGSVPINMGAATIENPVYGVNRFSLQRTEPFQHDDAIIDIMAVDNLPNELPRDASAHFGNHLEKYVLRELLLPKSDLIARATICANGLLTPPYEYLGEYAYGDTARPDTHQS
jgi:alanine dehydrogenase